MSVPPIRTNQEHAIAMREIDTLIASEPLSETQHARLVELAEAIDNFESWHPDHRLDKEPT